MGGYPGYFSVRKYTVFRIDARHSERVERVALIRTIGHVKTICPVTAVYQDLRNYFRVAGHTTTITDSPAGSPVISSGVLRRLRAALTTLRTFLEYNRGHVCRLLRAPNSGPTKSSRPWVRAEWVRCTARVIRDWNAVSPSRFCPRSFLASLRIASTEGRSNVEFRPSSRCLADSFHLGPCDTHIAGIWP